MATDNVAKKMAQASDRPDTANGGGAMPNVAEKMSHAGAHGATHADQGHHRPKKGDKFHCHDCGMEIQVTADCKSDEAAHFHCCGHEMHKH